MLNSVIAATALAKIQTYTPVADFASLLSLSHFSSNGAMQVQGLFVAFADPAAKYKSVIRDTSQEYGSYDYSVVMQPQEIIGRLDPMPGANGVIVMGKEGNYTLDIFKGSEVIASLDFNIRKFVMGDEYTGKTLYLFDGPWRKYGAFIYYPDGTVKFRLWGSVSEIDSTQTVKMTVTILNNGTVVGASKELVASKFEWKAFEYSFVKPDGKTTMGPADLAKLKGKLEIVVKINGQRTRSFVTEMKDGRPAGLPESALDFSPRSKSILPKTVASESNENLLLYLRDLVWVTTAK